MTDDNKHKKAAAKDSLAPTVVSQKVEEKSPPDDGTRLRPSTTVDKPADEADNKTKLRTTLPETPASPETLAPAETKVAPKPSPNLAPTQLAPDDATRLSTPLSKADNKTTQLHLTENPDAPITKIERMERTPRPTPGQPQREVDVGSVIRDRFILQEVLGRGGMGAVYRALDLIKKEAGDDKPYVAIKLLSGSFKEHPHAFVTLQREAKKTQDLAHPNIVTVYDFDREEDVVYLTMEQLSGAPLIDVLKGKTAKVLDDKEKISVITQIAKGLAYAHTKGIVHSDLKPANLFLTDDNIVKILDFGIARAANQELYQDSFDVGQLGALTLSYASPEMIRFEPPHPSDDIYALGIIICEILGGVHPFDRKDAKTAIEEGLEPKIPDIKNPFIRKCIRQTLSLERDTRTADAEVFLKRFNNAIAAPKRITMGLAAVTLALIINYFYIQTIEVEAVPFKSLAAEQQVEFHKLIEDGYTALKFQDLQEAVVKFNSAYEIHGTNDDIKKAIRTVEAIFEENIANAGDEKSRAFIQDQINELKQYPAFSNIDKF